MSTTVIKIENLYKEYRLGVIGHGTLYRDLQSWCAAAMGKEDPNSLIGHTGKGKVRDRILALNDINLEIENGEVLGIIGANGAGKSTLLKILSRVTAPTKGSIKAKGRIASLLEVGTGFHTELTGRENIYLNGAINGMNRKEVSRKLDEIVDFAGVEQFIDTPVKRYSSGMHVRLGFAVAAHLDPDILVVDEVLAVGDASFRKKAVNKMKDVSKGEGRTVLFVSHNMESIKNLCTRAVLLKEGKVINNGPTEEVIERYLTSVSDDVNKYAGERTWNMDNAPGNDVVRLMAIRTMNEKGEVCSEFDVTEPVLIEFGYRVLKEGHQIASIIEVSFANSNQVAIRAVDDYSRGPWGKQPAVKTGFYNSTCKIPGNLLGEGHIIINLRIFSPPFAANLSEQVKALNIISFTTTDSMATNGSRGSYPYPLGEALRPKLDWQTTRG
jgi:lipopolysaccharide transport system ATP-binding protein